MGLFAVNCQPTTGADPFGLRRAAYGLIETVTKGNAGLDLKLREAVVIAAKKQPVDVSLSIYICVYVCVCLFFENLQTSACR